MIHCKLALLSSNVITQGQLPYRSNTPEPYAILIEQGIITDLIPLSQANIPNLRTQYLVEDLGDLFISPGLVDLNVNFNCESSATITKAAVSGGVTTIATTSKVQEAIFCDVAPIAEIHDWNLNEIQDLKDQCFGYKCYLIAQGAHGRVLTKIEEAVQEVAETGLPLHLHPEYASQDLLEAASPYRMLDTDKRQSLELPPPCEEEVIPEIETFAASDEDSDDEFDPIHDFDTGSMLTPASNGATRRTSLNCPTFVPPFSRYQNSGIDNKRNSLPNVLQGLSLASRQRIQSGIFLQPPSNTQRYSVDLSLNPPVIPLPKITDYRRASEEEYSIFLNTFSSKWEIRATDKLIEYCRVYNCRLHVSNISASQAALHLKDQQSTGLFTCETSVPYLYFHKENILPNDPRFKSNPPIRDKGNCEQLWYLLKTRVVDCVSSYHKSVPPAQKFLMGFRRAVNGISSIGYGLQAVWTRLAEEVRGSATERVYFSLLANWMSKVPAEILGLSNVKGEIAPGKHADLVIWDPYGQGKAGANGLQSPDNCPFIGQEFQGVVHRTYVRGNLVFSRNANGAVGGIGQVLNRCNVQFVFWKKVRLVQFNRLFLFASDIQLLQYVQFNIKRTYNNGKSQQI